MQIDAWNAGCESKSKPSKGGRKVFCHKLMPYLETVNLDANCQTGRPCIGKETDILNANCGTKCRPPNGAPPKDTRVYFYANSQMKPIQLPNRPQMHSDVYSYDKSAIQTRTIAINRTPIQSMLKFLFHLKNLLE